MNNQLTYTRQRRRQLFIVEGHNEKNTLLSLLIRCFPEVDIDLDDVIIYGSNIYNLYNSIQNYYGEDWYNDEDGIDLAFLVSSLKQIDKLYKEDFTNIFIVFDYERHHPFFSEDKINKMQEYFKDSTDVGQLYINYPMVESYLDFSSSDTVDFLDKKLLINSETSNYKNKCNKNEFAKVIDLYKNRDNHLVHKFNITDTIKWTECMENILSITTSNNISDEITQILSSELDQSYINTAIHFFTNILERCNYNYYDYVRKTFQQIIKQNILKAYKIQQGTTSNLTLTETFHSIDLLRILHKQNQASNLPDPDSFIWILNTCIMLIADYNPALIDAN